MADRDVVVAEVRRTFGDRLPELEERLSTIDALWRLTDDELLRVAGVNFVVAG